MAEQWGQDDNHNQQLKVSFLSTFCPHRSAVPYAGSSSGPGGAFAQLEIRIMLRVSYCRDIAVRIVVTLSMMVLVASLAVAGDQPQPVRLGPQNAATQGGTGLARPDVEFSIFQFPTDQIPRIDGNADDWSVVPDSYSVGMDQLRETVVGIGDKRDPKNLDVKVKVGWVNGQNHLYFLYEASDNYWDFSREDLHNDIFEIVIDGDLSGGPLSRQMHPNKTLREKPETHFSFHGVHAQNYHIFTPAAGKDWAMVWGSQPWIKDLPFANAACRYNFKHGESGKLVLEFFVTPFDHAPPDRSRAVQTQLKEDNLIGLSWAILDYDDEKAERYGAFWNLSHKTTMYGDASDLVVFRLMPIEASLRKPVEADWTFKVVSQEDRVVAFRDRSFGKLTSWLWDFGDGTTSTERHPIHRYEKPGEFVVTLKVAGPDGGARRTKVWDVTLP